jgi:hypothetical protein
MRGRSGSLISSRLILAAIVLTANVGAPFSTSRLVRVFLRSEVKNTAAQSVVRVRVVAQFGSLQGFRAVVGCSGGEPSKRIPGTSNRVLAPLLPLRIVFQPCQFRCTASGPNAPLRC